MARAIDAENAIKKLEDIGGHLIYEEDGKSFCITMDALIRFINNLPTIDPVKHGKWVIAKDKDGFAMWDACSSCGHGLHYVCEGKRFPYCPNCGARMDGE